MVQTRATPWAPGCVYRKQREIEDGNYRTKKAREPLQGKELRKEHHLNWRPQDEQDPAGRDAARRTHLVGPL